MELWIRTQDKDILMKIDNLLIDDEKNDIYTHNCINNMQMTYTIGRYKSKERALEVLDEIQNWMLKGAFSKKVNGLGEELDLIPNPIFIYEMPEN